MSDDTKARLEALEQLLVEAAMEPFDIGPCYVAGPFDFAKKHSGEVLQVTEKRLEGVFEQLLDRVQRRLPDTVRRVNEREAELASLRAKLDAAEADARRWRAVRPFLWTCHESPGCTGMRIDSIQVVIYGATVEQIVDALAQREATNG